jgi:hypothetical protein
MSERGSEDQAARLYRRALGLLDQAVGPEHPTRRACEKLLATRRTCTAVSAR